MDCAVQTTGLVKAYGRRRALDGLTLSVPRYSVLGLVGPNGAGKTSWMMAVAGFLHLDGGEVDLLGGGPFSAEIHSGRFTILPQDAELPLEASPLDLLVRFGRLQGLSAREAARSAGELLHAVNLQDRERSPIRTLSHGMRKRVMIAQCFLGYPEVVFLDEPMSGLDPREVARIRDFILSRQGRVTVVISSHNLNEIEALCTHVAFVERGRSVRIATLNALTAKNGRLVYHLSSAPVNLPLLERAVPEARLVWKGEEGILVCTFPEGENMPETINSRLIPSLLDQAGLLSIEQGNSLENTYLKTNK